MTDKFVSNAKPPTPHERELLTILSEEAAEVIEMAAEITLAATRVQQRASKALRFGLDEVQPGQHLTNAQRLAREIGDFWYVSNEIMNEETLSEDEAQEGWVNKQRQLAKFMQSEPGDKS